MFLWAGCAHKRVVGREGETPLLIRILDKLGPRVLQALKPHLFPGGQKEDFPTRLQRTRAGGNVACLGE